MRIVFAHTNFPAQFGALGAWLAGQGCEVVFITQRAGASDAGPVRIVHCEDHRKPSPQTHRYVRPLERATITGQAFARAALGLRKTGFVPDLVVAHSGWGAGTYSKDVWPEAAYVPYYEWYYSYPPVDRTPYDPAGDPVDGAARTRTRNAPFWLDFSATTVCLSPTRFQAVQFPPFMRQRILVHHDGIDTDLNRPGDGSRAILARWNVPEDAEVLTSITRAMEPHRGFPETMRAIAALQKRRPKLHAVVGGEDRIAYGAQLPAGESWKQRMLSELELDHDRLHFTGLLSRSDMIALMQASDVHSYLTVPFVLSWSLLDAMSCGCLIVASDAPPVREFLTDGETGLTVPMHDVDALVSRLEEALDNAAALRRLRENARRTVVDTLDAQRVIYPAKKALFARILAAARAGANGSGEGAAVQPPSISESLGGEPRQLG